MFKWLDVTSQAKSDFMFKVNFLFKSNAQNCMIFCMESWTI